ncbi:putative Glucoamylase [Cordyceps fumosorosea ARSEF 2679]|uniref:Putative Glucoamylase n=1 Tax=Cordyceps fumosorosea (strain ARSEF 2679) TaxID=1081104 RepID=A0A167D1D3_CORFA|nr:putative Glucoamylase [Cordyceps fumosorosea ARSEF 2679]OAA41835.1 putative Glucoamylase [Cordyceps fumosorosea ARSEF 2679]
MHYATLLLAAAAALPSVSGRTTLHTRNGKPVVETTTLANGQVIDWVMSDEVAPPTGIEDTLDQVTRPLNGPNGAVPYLRPSPAFASKVKTLPDQQEALSKRSVPLNHKYVFTKQAVSNHGGGASFSLYDPYLQDTNSDFSLIQLAVSNTNVYNSTNQNIQQTLEAGWQKYPAFNPPEVHFFTFFNTNGYNGIGNGLAGYNQDVKGWVQLDPNVHPGYSGWTLSIDGNSSAQYDVDMRYSLVGDKWYLAINGRNIGYYPASLFQNGNIAQGSSTLQTTADHMAFYGEIYSTNAYTTTDMGSGEFANQGYAKAAYMRNMVYVDTSDATQNYSPPSSNDIVTDSSAYTMEKHFNSGVQDWNSYMFVGGPGYGGNVGS